MVTLCFYFRKSKLQLQQLRIFLTFFSFFTSLSSQDACSTKKNKSLHYSLQFSILTACLFSKANNESIHFSFSKYAFKIFRILLLAVCGFYSKRFCMNVGHHMRFDVKSVIAQKFHFLFEMPKSVYELI